MIRLFFVNHAEAYNSIVGISLISHFTHFSCAFFSILETMYDIEKSYLKWLIFGFIVRLFFFSFFVWAMINSVLFERLLTLDAQLVRPFGQFVKDVSNG